MTEQTRQPATTPDPGDLSTGPPTNAETDALLDTINTTLGPASDDHGSGAHDLARASARRIQAVRLRLLGTTYDRIAQICGYTDKSSAAKAVKNALAKIEVETVSELRTLENLRIDADEQELRTIIANTTSATVKIRALDSRRNLSARRSRLNGLDAPVAVTLSAGVAADLADALDEAEALFVRGEVTGRSDERLEG